MNYDFFSGNMIDDRLQFINIYRKLYGYGVIIASDSVYRWFKMWGREIFDFLKILMQNTEKVKY